MFLTRLKLAAAMILVLVVTVAAVTYAKQSAGPLEGDLKGIDIGKDTLAIMITNGRRENLTFPVAKDVAVLINGHRHGFQDLKLGMIVRLTLSEDQTTVIAIDEQSQQRGPRRDLPKCSCDCDPK